MRQVQRPCRFREPEQAMSRADPPFSEPVLETAGSLRIEPSALERQIGMDGAEPACVKDMNHYSAPDFGDDRWLAGDSFENRLLIRPGKKSVAGIETGKSLANHFHYAAHRCSHPETPVGVFEQLEDVRVT